MIRTLQYIQLHTGVTGCLKLDELLLFDCLNIINFPSLHPDSLVGSVFSSD